MADLDAEEAGGKRAAEAIVAVGGKKRQKLQQQPRSRPKSGFYGVYAKREKWRAQIRYRGMLQSLGNFDTKEQAAFAYDQAARRHAPDRPLSYESTEAARNFPLRD